SIWPFVSVTSRLAPASGTRCGAPTVLLHLHQLARPPPRTYETIISLIGNTTNRGGLVVRAPLDRRRYPTGKKVSAKELRELKVAQDDLHGDWYYVIKPRTERR